MCLSSLYVLPITVIKSLRCNAGCPQRTAYQRIICTGLFVGYCAMARYHVCQSTYRYVEDRRRCVSGVRSEGGLT